MDTAIDIATVAGVLRLGGALDIYGAEALHEALLARFGEGAEIVVDLEKVEACDAAGIQLLLSARRKAAQSSRVIRFENVPAAVRDCRQRLGLSGEL